MLNTKELLETRFTRMYKGCKLYCIQLNGFTHRVFYKDQQGSRKIEYVSSYDSSYNNFEDGLHAFNLDKTKVLFAGIPNYAYQNNAQELIFEEKGW